MADTQKNAAAVTTEEKPAEAADAVAEVAAEALGGDLSDIEHISKRDKHLLFYVRKVHNPDTQQYIIARIMSEMSYYSKQSAAHKKQYYLFSTISIVLGALIPVASIFTGGPLCMKVVIAALGSSVTAINAYLSLRNSRDIWVVYRKTMTQEEKDKLLIETCEAMLNKEHSESLETQNKKEGE